MPRKQMNIRLDDLTRETIKRIAERWNMSESQVITRGVVLLEQELQKNIFTHKPSDMNTGRNTRGVDRDDEGGDIPH